MSGPDDLGALLSEYAPLEDADSHAVALGALDAGRPMWPRSEFEPGHFTASGFVMHPDGSGLLLIHHARLGRWLQPGGHIEPEDATIEQAARREVAEETGITALDRLGEGLLRIDAHDIPPRHDEPAHVHIDLGMAFRSTTDRIGPIAEVLDARWVPWTELDLIDTDDAVRLSARRLRLMADG